MPPSAPLRESPKCPFSFDGNESEGLNKGEVKYRAVPVSAWSSMPELCHVRGLRSEQGWVQSGEEKDCWKTLLWHLRALRGQTILLCWVQPGPEPCREDWRRKKPKPHPQLHTGHATENKRQADEKTSGQRDATGPGRLGGLHSRGRRLGPGYKDWEGERK